MTPEFFSELIYKTITSRSDWLVNLFAPDDVFEDAIDHSKKSPVAALAQGTMFAPENHIQTRLGHVSVNPNDPANSAVLRNAYVYCGQDTKFPTTDRTLNRDPAVAEAFLRGLIRRTKEFREISLNKGHPDPTGRVLTNERNFLILGERGCGKTFFINHLFTRFHSLLDEEKVIWVRVNLVPDRGYDDNIHNWIYAQTSKILLRYYDSDSQRNLLVPSACKVPYYRQAQTWILNNFSGMQADRYIDSLEEMRQAFAISDNDQEISPSLCNPIISRELYRIARRAGFSFIFVLDGLDRLESDHYYTERFINISKTVRSLWNSYELLGCVFVYVTRGETFAANRNVAPYNMFEPSEYFSIQAVGIEKIIDARVDALVTEMLELQRTKPELWGNKDWVGIVRDFRESIFSNADPFETVSYLDETFATNNRAKVQIVQLKFQEYMKLVSHQAYKLIEHMMLAGRRYPPMYYKYEFVDGRLEIRIPDQSHIDNRYLPVITRPPLPSVVRADGAPKKNWYSSDSILLGIRLLQLVVGYERWASAEDKDSEPITVSEVVDVLSGVFGYEREQIIAMIWELDNFEILRPIYNGNGIERTENTYLGSFPKANYIMQSCISDVAYLNLCGMRTLINQKYFKSPRFFREAFLDHSDPKSFERWIIAKIVNATSMTMLLYYVNAKQRAIFHKKRAEIKVRPELSKFVHHIMPTFFDFLDSVIPAIRHELTSIYVTATNPRGTARIKSERLEDPIIDIAQRLIEERDGGSQHKRNN